MKYLNRLIHASCCTRCISLFFLCLVAKVGAAQDTLQTVVDFDSTEIFVTDDTTIAAAVVTTVSIVFDSAYKRVKLKPLEWSPTINKKRLTAACVGTVGGYAAFMTAVGISWYGNEKLGHFRWFRDEKEWLQIDKTGHFFAPYFITTYGYNMLRWAGMKNVPAALTAGAFSFLAMSAVEVPDGLSVKYGASWSDIVFNFSGASLATLQYIFWKEQRITVKYSFHHVNYPVGELRDRAYDLYGEGFGERILKDYNGVTMWLSFNLHSFNHNIKPTWLNIAFGYAAGNLYGGFENKWTDKNGVYHDRSDLQRYRRFIISLDADLTKIKTNTRGGKLVLGILNIIKLPFPAIEFNTLGQFVFHPMYFLNFNTPISVNMKRR